MAKQKNIPLPPPEIDVNALGVSGVQPDTPKNKRKNSGCSCLLLIVLTLGIVTFIGAASKPKDPAPVAALAATEPARAATKTVTPYPDITMTSTQPATFEEEEASLKELPGVMSVEHIERNGTDYAAIIKTHPRFNKESFANLIHIQAIQVDLYITRFAVQIDDGGSEPLWWIYNEKFEWSSSKNAPAWVDMDTARALSVRATSTRRPATSTSGGGSASGRQSSTPIQSTPMVWDCSGDIYNCDSFGSRAQMQNYFDQCPGDPSNLDGNADGQYCES